MLTTCLCKRILHPWKTVSKLWYILWEKKIVSFKTFIWPKVGKIILLMIPFLWVKLMDGYQKTYPCRCGYNSGNLALTNNYFNLTLITYKWMLTLSEDRSLLYCSIKTAIFFLSDASSSRSWPHNEHVTWSVTPLLATYRRNPWRHISVLTIWYWALFTSPCYPDL